VALDQEPAGIQLDLLGPQHVEFVPHPREVVGAGTVLVDGTVCSTWDW
jgi:hypothetical protein